MHALLSTIGSRGDVQPLLALAVELNALGHTPSLCVPPNFKEWVESFGFVCHPIGPDVRQLARAAPSKPMRPTKAQRQQLAVGTIREQFRVLSDAARGCDLLVGGGALQLALRSIAESLDTPYVYVSYCPAALPSPDHPPARMLVHYPQWLPGVVNRILWLRDASSWNGLFRTPLNDERAKLGLAGVTDVQRYVVTERPWLAVDPVLAPAPKHAAMEIVETGAWFPHDETSLPADLERFLNDGEPPVYLGFGSMRGPEQTGPMLVQSARRIGRRAILSQGWANLGSSGRDRQCLVIGDVNHQALFPRVAAVVHHGGAGTTQTTARAGRPHVVIPHHYDQFYWASRVEKLGIGVSTLSRESLTVDALATALERCLRPELTVRAAALAARLSPDGARIAAQRFVTEFA